MLDDADRLMSRIQIAERIAAVTTDLDSEVTNRYSSRGRQSLPTPFNIQRDIRLAYAMLRDGPDSLSSADADYAADSLARERRIIVAMMGGTEDALPDEDRAQYVARFGKLPGAAFQNAGSEGSNPGGGYTVAPLFEADLLIALKAYGGMRATARVISTPTGASLPWPTIDDTGNVATIISAENAQLSNGTDLAFGQLALGAFTYVSGLMPVSLELLQDSAFDFNELVRNAMAIRFARGQNAHFTTGTGAGQPYGALTQATLGVTGATGQTTSVTYDNLVDLFHSVDPAYRKGASFQMNDDSFRAIRMMKGTDGKPLWQPSVQMGEPDTLLGAPVVMNQAVPAMAANAKSIVFGDFRSYVIRDTLGLQVAVFRERYVDFLQVAWNGYMRSDGRLISAGQPIKYYQNSAT